MKSHNNLHCNLGNRQGSNKSPSFGVPLDFGTPNKAYIACSSVTRLGVKVFNVIVRLYEINKDTQEIILDSLQTVDYTEDNPQFALTNTNDYTMFIGRHENQFSGLNILRTKYLKIDSSLSHDIETIDIHINSMLNEYKVLNKELLKPIEKTYVAIMNHNINDPLCFVEKTNWELTKMYSLENEAVLGTTINLNNILNYLCIETSVNTVKHSLYGSMFFNDFSGHIIFQPVASSPSTYTLFKITNLNGEDVLHFYIESGNIRMKVYATLDSHILSVPDNNLPSALSFNISKYKNGENLYNVVWSLYQFDTASTTLINKNTFNIINHDLLADMNFENCILGNDGEHVKIGTTVIYNYFMYQSQLDGLLFESIEEYQRVNPYESVQNLCEIDTRHPSVVYNGTTLTNIIDVNSGDAVPIFQDIHWTSINSHTAAYFSSGFIHVNIGTGFSIWLNQGATPVLNTICVLSITQNTLDSGGDSIICSHGDPSGDKHFISGYRSNSNSSLNGVYNNNERTSNEFSQLPNRFRIGKYILFTTIHNLIQDTNKFVISQHVYDIDGTYLESSSKTLASSSYDSDFEQLLFIGPQKGMTSEYSHYTIGYLKYCSGTLSTEDRHNIVSTLSNSWKQKKIFTYGNMP